jgi:hypothetical protein
MTIFKMSRKNGRKSLMAWMNSKDSPGPLTEVEFERAIKFMMPACNDSTAGVKASPGSTLFAKNVRNPRQY